MPRQLHPGNRRSRGTFQRLHLAVCEWVPWHTGCQRTTWGCQFFNLEFLGWNSGCSAWSSHLSSEPLWLVPFPLPLPSGEAVSLQNNNCIQIQFWNVDTKVCWLWPLALLVQSVWRADGQLFSMDFTAAESDLFPGTDSVNLRVSA